MSWAHGGEQALFCQFLPGLIFVHCRSHVLQLALVKAASTVPVINPLDSVSRYTAQRIQQMAHHN